MRNGKITIICRHSEEIILCHLFGNPSVLDFGSQLNMFALESNFSH